MSRLSEHSTLDEVIQAIDSRLVHAFSEIPQPHQTESVACAWLKKTSLTGIWLHNSFDDVPSECRSARFMLLAAQKGCPALRDATPEQYDNYTELALASITANPIALSDLDPRFRNDRMVEHAQNSWPKNMFFVAYGNKWILKAMSDELLDRLARADSLFALIAPQDRLRDPLHSYMTLGDISKNMWACHIIRKNCHLPMLAAKVREGEWFDVGLTKMKKPDTLEHAVQELGDLWPNNDKGEIILMAYIMSHPIDEVVKAMTGTSLKKLLLEMYSQVELEPFLKEDVGLRGAMLEGALGL